MYARQTSGHPKVVLLLNIRLGWKGLAGNDTLAYYENSLITVAKIVIILATGANVIKLFTFVSYVFHNKLVFVPGKPIRSSLMFVSKVRCLPYSGAPERPFTWVGSGLTPQTLD